LLDRLREHGDAFESHGATFTFNPAHKAMDLVVGDRVPTVQSVTVSAAGVPVPSITYQTLGMMAKLAAARWERAAGTWRIQHAIRFEASGMGRSGLVTGGGVELPTFIHRTMDAVHTFSSGEPAYFTYQGSLSSYDSQGAMATLFVVRICMTRQE
jgi:hypothetical protein